MTVPIRQTFNKSCDIIMRDQMKA